MGGGREEDEEDGRRGGSERGREGKRRREEERGRERRRKGEREIESGIDDEVEDMHTCSACTYVHKINVILLQLYTQLCVNITFLVLCISNFATMNVVNITIILHGFM